MEQMLTRWTSQTCKPGEFVKGDILITTEAVFEIIAEVYSAEPSFCQFLVFNLETCEPDGLRIPADDDSCVIVRPNSGSSA